MKSVFIFFAVLAASTFAEYSLVEREVHVIIHDNPSITETDCIQKCDNVFGLLDPIDEANNDIECAEECHCHITNPLCDAQESVNKSSTLKQSLFTFVLSAVCAISLLFV
ncbi:unnamed protein product [Candidula unifasciata]|uniref:Uncharacterized protein n=1 Tax=Candidula unifasciata TaxID=100452 RepID=A0A8S4A138_9EUPU|nr:unnamed protein product [Candidula unifasciata]